MRQRSRKSRIQFSVRNFNPTSNPKRALQIQPAMGGTIFRRIFLLHEMLPGNVETTEPFITLCSLCVDCVRTFRGKQKSHIWNSWNEFSLSVPSTVWINGDPNWAKVNAHQFLIKWCRGVVVYVLDRLENRLLRA